MMKFLIENLKNIVRMVVNKFFFKKKLIKNNYFYNYISSIDIFNFKFIKQFSFGEKFIFHRFFFVFFFKFFYDFNYYYNNNSINNIVINFIVGYKDFEYLKLKFFNDLNYLVIANYFSFNFNFYNFFFDSDNFIFLCDFFIFKFSKISNYNFFFIKLYCFDSNLFLFFMNIFSFSFYKFFSDFQLSSNRFLFIDNNFFQKKIYKNNYTNLFFLKDIPDINEFWNSFMFFELIGFIYKFELNYDDKDGESFIKLFQFEDINIIKFFEIYITYDFDKKYLIYKKDIGNIFRDHFNYLFDRISNNSYHLDVKIKYKEYFNQTNNSEEGVFYKIYKNFYLPFGIVEYYNTFLDYRSFSDLIYNYSKSYSNSNSNFEVWLNYSGFNNNYNLINNFFDNFYKNFVYSNTYKGTIKNIFEFHNWILSFYPLYTSMNRYLPFFKNFDRRGFYDHDIYEFYKYHGIEELIYSFGLQDQEDIGSRSWVVHDDYLSVRAEYINRNIRTSIFNFQFPSYIINFNDYFDFRFDFIIDENNVKFDYNYFLKNNYMFNFDGKLCYSNFINNFNILHSEFEFRVLLIREIIDLIWNLLTVFRNEFIYINRLYTLNYKNIRYSRKKLLENGKEKDIESAAESVFADYRYYYNKFTNNFYGILNYTTYNRLIKRIILNFSKFLYSFDIFDLFIIKFIIEENISVFINFFKTYKFDSILNYNFIDKSIKSFNNNASKNKQSLDIFLNSGDISNVFISTIFSLDNFNSAVFFNSILELFFDFELFMFVFFSTITEKFNDEYYYSNVQEILEKIFFD